MTQKMPQSSRGQGRGQPTRRRRGLVLASVSAIGAAAVARPGRTAAGLLALVGASAFGWNTLFHQTANHPHPLFGPDVAALQPTVPPKRPETFAAAMPPARPDTMSTASITKPVAPDGKTSAADTKGADPIGQLIRTANGPTTAAAAPADRPAPATVEKPAPAKVATAQKALSKLGYGKLDANGVLGSATKTALEKFERDNKLPVTGSLAKRTTRQLAQASGVTID